MLEKFNFSKLFNFGLQIYQFIKNPVLLCLKAGEIYKTPGRTSFVNLKRAETFQALLVLW
tara:strand:+ start:4157 stop:4336 length:180 start_codon:yes stop_codon:yes gene_type:complete